MKLIIIRIIQKGNENLLSPKSFGVPFIKTMIIKDVGPAHVKI